MAVTQSSIHGVTLSGSRGLVGTRAVGQGNFSRSFAVTFDAGITSGFFLGGALLAPQNGCDLAAYNSASLTPSATLVPGLPMEASASLALSLASADLGLITNLESPITSTFTPGSITLSAVSALESSTILSLTLDNAELGAIVGLSTNLSASLIGSADAIFLLHMSGDMSLITDFSPSKLASAVWGTAAAEYDSVGSFGGKLNDLQANLWSQVIESGLSAEEIMRILLAVAAGKTTITDTGSGTANVKFKSVDGLTDRVEAAMIGSQRATVTLGGS